MQILLAALIATALLAAACATQPPAADPAALQAQLEAFRRQERDLVRATVTDADRAERLLSLLDERDRLVAESTLRLKEKRKRMAQLNADYHAGRDRFEALMAEFSGERSDAQSRFVALIGEMKAQTTRAEWRVIAPFQLKHLNPRKLVYGQPAGESGES
jgi:septal ring factor EnvC (AmiA/AmiB activator)